MTAAIHGVTFVEAGPHSHQRRYVDGRPVWHCATWDGPCQGHVRPASPVRPCPAGHVDGFAANPRGHRVCLTCRDERRAAGRQRFNIPLKGRAA